MNRLLLTLLAASFALTAVAAVAENTVSENRARLAAAWEKAQGTERSGPVAAATIRAPGPGRSPAADRPAPSAGQ